MRRLAAWIATAVLLVAAGLVSHFAPPDDAEIAPFVVAGAPGDHLIGRDLAATATDATRTGLLMDTTGWSAAGTWFVVDLEVMNVTGSRLAEIDNAGSLHGAMLLVDGRSYRATERVWDSLLTARLFPGVPRSGALAFELAAPPAPGSVLVLQLSPESDTRGDSVLEISFDADAVPHVAEYTMPATGWAS